MEDIDSEQIAALRRSIDVLVRNFKVADSSQVSKTTPKLNQADMQGILFVADHPNSIVGELVEFLRLPPTTISAMLNRLEKYGIVERIHSSENRRVVHLRLSAVGESVASAIREKQDAHCAQMLSALEPDERCQLVLSMVKIAESLK